MFATKLYKNRTFITLCNNIKDLHILLGHESRNNKFKIIIGINCTLLAIRDTIEGEVSLKGINELYKVAEGLHKLEILYGTEVMLNFIKTRELCLFEEIISGTLTYNEINWFDINRIFVQNIEDVTTTKLRAISVLNTDTPIAILSEVGCDNDNVSIM